MDNKELIKQSITERFVFKMREIASVVALSDYALILGGNRINWELLEQEGQTIIRGLLTFATQEQPLMRIPSSWKEAFKERWFPAWLKRKTPVRYTEVVAVHKFPELQVPSSVLGGEFVHLDVVNMDRLQRLLAKQELKDG